MYVSLFYFNLQSPPIPMTWIINYKSTTEPVVKNI